ncbi:MAG: cytochrome c1, partial [Alphaproteobacteria bacterium]|nr:cytochrome c1 [Alphaproteobacteria bacterium]
TLRSFQSFLSPQRAVNAGRAALLMVSPTLRSFQSFLSPQRAVNAGQANCLFQRLTVKVTAMAAVSMVVLRAVNAARTAFLSRKLTATAAKIAAVSMVVLTVGVLLSPDKAYAAGEGGKKPPRQSWSFNGPFGVFDKSAAQRGLQVYREVCAACHSLKHVAFRNIAALGYNPDQVKAFAAEYQILDGPNDEGDSFERPGLPSDKFPSPFPNDNAARAANGGALPPDLSLMIKARAGGADYMHALLTGYRDAPAEHEVGEGLYYNPYYSTQQLAMAPPLTLDLVEYADGTPATVEQMSHDVVNFLAWAAEPEMETRKATGLKALLFLGALSVVLLLATRRVWSRVE